MFKKRLLTAAAVGGTLTAIGLLFPAPRASAAVVSTSAADSANWARYVANAPATAVASAACRAAGCSRRRTQAAVTATRRSGSGSAAAASPARPAQRDRSSRSGRRRTSVAAKRSTTPGTSLWRLRRLRTRRIRRIRLPRVRVLTDAACGRAAARLADGTSIRWREGRGAVTPSVTSRSERSGSKAATECCTADTLNRVQRANILVTPRRAVTPCLECPPDAEAHRIPMP